MRHIELYGGLDLCHGLLRDEGWKNTQSVFCSSIVTAMHMVFQPCISQLLFVLQEFKNAALLKYLENTTHYHI